MDPTRRLRDVPWGALSGLGGVARAAIESVLAGAAAERVVDRTLRDHRGLSGEQRTALVEAVFGVALWRRRLAWHAGVAPIAQDAAALLFALLRDLAGLDATEAGALAGLAEVPTRRGPPADLASKWSFPDWIVDSFVRDYGAVEADALCAALNLPGPISLRANTLRTSREDLAALLAQEGVPTRPGAWSPLALVIEGKRANILGLTAHREGLFEVQDQGSQLLGLLVDAKPGETVLDLCAGAGGKTLLLAAAMRNEGELHAYDVDGEKLDRLARRAGRAGVRNLRIHRTPPDLACDAVLVDAPCSELGTLRRGPDARFRIDPAAAEALPELQLRLLTDAARHLRPGGRLVYATCTLRAEENERVADRLQALHPALTVRPPPAPWLHESLRRGRYLSTLPHRHGTDGFFAAVFQMGRHPA